MSRVAALVDVDGDGDLDAFVGNGHTDDTDSPNTIWFNEGAGNFVDSGQQLGKDYDDTQSLAVGDLDGDGDLDAIFGNQASPNSVWLNGGNGQLTQRQVWQVGGSGWPNNSQLALGDLDGDGDLDAFDVHCCRGKWVRMKGPDEIIAQGYSDAFNLIWLNDGSGLFVDSGQQLGNQSTHAAALGDLDGDGDLDAFVGNEGGDGENFLGEPANEVWLNDGAGRFSDSRQRLGDSDTFAVALGDLDGDGDLDAYVGNAQARPVPGRVNEVWLNDSAGNFSDSGQRLGNDNTYLVVLSDFDRDGDLDAFAGNDYFGQLWLNDGTGRFVNSEQSLRYGQDSAIAVGDVDGDGDEDVFAIHFVAGYRVWLNDGAGRFNQK